MSFRRQVLKPLLAGIEDKQQRGRDEWIGVGFFLLRCHQQGELLRVATSSARRVFVVWAKKCAAFQSRHRLEQEQWIILATAEDYIVWWLFKVGTSTMLLLPIWSVASRMQGWRVAFLKRHFLPVSVKPTLTIRNSNRRTYLPHHASRQVPNCTRWAFRVARGWLSHLHVEI